MKTCIRKAAIFLFLLLAFIPVWADEGMWIPMLLEQLNQKYMIDLGMRLTAEDIYSINHSSLKDAIVQFGGGCTAEIVSPQGLVFTNHHCALGSIQRHSSLEHDYLRDGFWAGSMEEELPNPGLIVTLLVRMEDVTEKALKGVTVNMNQLVREQIVKKNIEIIEKEAVEGTHYQAKIKPFFYGNQYYLFVTEVFKDIRLVGAPPSAIGQFGGDTDNWTWPRHGGDFSVFRIYAGKNNESAEYSKDNVPYHPKRFLEISLKGYKQGDFTMVFGYPGSTREYLTSWGVDLIANKENPIRIALRQQRLDVMNEAMNADPAVRIQYTSKHQAIANGWKKMQGETRGIHRLDAVVRKQEFEKQFQAWVDRSAAPVRPLSHLLDNFKDAYEQILPVDLASVYLTEAGMGIEAVKYASGFRDLVKICRNLDTQPEEITQMVNNLKKSSRGFFKDYQPSIDHKIARALLNEMQTHMTPEYLPDCFSTISKKYDGNFSRFADDMFSESLFTDSTRMMTFLSGFRKKDIGKIERDPAFQLSSGIYYRYEQTVTFALNKLNNRIDSLQRIYMAAQMAMQKDKRFYPDANLTMRVSYGQVKGYNPADAVSYNYFTTSDGILQKEDTSVYDYAIPQKLHQMFLKKDFGRYADADGTLHISFIAGNHTTGGMSGSPVLNADGQLIGLNFDRNWEGTQSDLMYDPDQCRNIILDIRYCLFIIDRYAGAKRLVDELVIRGTQVE